MALGTPSSPAPETLPLYGERLCLDFANTVDPRHSEHPREFLADYDDLVRWAVHAGALEGSAAAALATAAAHDPPAAVAAFRRAVALREALYATFSAIAAGAPVPAPALERLNAVLASSLQHARLVPAPAGFRWTWGGEDTDLDRILWPIARSAADLLAEGPLERVRECPGEDGCGWLFLDVSKNGRRRWCSMEGCGNRAKARRFAARRSRA
jgi:predicted RNA-binding Zn ribbon-like protein